MSVKDTNKISVLAIIFIFSLLAVTPAASAQDTVYDLDNGMTVILKENHSSPMVTSMVFVRSGSKYESEYENGITHFLEHLLFDGTINKSREEIDGSIRDLGGYINAFTRKDMTAYLVLLPKQYIDYGMTVQADMLFNSTIPAEELPKERKVVIEEINRDKDGAGYAADKFFTEKAYANTSYNRPVLGYKAFIENISRDAIVNYWKKFYRPEKMTLLIIGDFEAEEMKNKVQNIFGSVNIPPLPVDDMTNRVIETDSNAINNLNPETTPDELKKPNLQFVFDTVANVQSMYINYSIEAPKFSDSDYLPLDLLCMYYGMDDISPLMTALKGGAEPLASEASIGLSAYPEFSRIEISVVSDNVDMKDSIISVINNFFLTAPQHQADPEALIGIKTSVKTDNIYTSEKLHYLGFMVGPMMMTAGYDFVQTYPDRLDSVQWTDCQQAASRWLVTPSYTATVVRPASETDIPYTPYEMSEENVKAFFDTAAFSYYNLDSGYTLTYPETESVSFELADKAEYHREVFDNGLTVIIKSRPDSRVFAMNILGKNRTANEPDGKEGITDFVNRCIEKGTATRDASELSRDLAKIGANVTLYDNPWIPYDDRYTSRSFSFMKFETIDEFAEKGFHLFSDMVLLPSFPNDEVENIRRSMLGVLGRDSGTPSKIADNLFYATLFTGSKFARPIMGTPQSIASITVEDLKKYHNRYYAPENLILSIVTNKPIAEVTDWVKTRFGKFSKQNAELFQPTAPEPLFTTKTNHSELDKEQINIYIGSGLPGANSSDATAINIATAILSERLYLNLREKQGLAYSVGAGSRFDNNFGWTYSVIGTSAENYQTALDGILLEIDKLRLDGPRPDELNRAKNQTWGRLMSAKLSSINQAYYLALDEFLNRKLGYDNSYLKQLQAISLDDIRRVASNYFKTDNYILATAGKKIN